MKHSLKGLCCALTFISLLLFSNLHAQQRSCGMQQHMNELLQDEDFRRNYEKKRDFLKKQRPSEGARVLCANPVVIPVAIHFQNISNPDAPCLATLAQNQVDILNADFQGLNVDIANWINTDSNQFPGVNYGETCLSFCIATFNHPTGYGLTEGQPAVTINTTSGSSDSNWSGYLNIWVRNINFLGFSPLGGTGNGDGVTIDTEAFGSGAGCNGVVPSAPYDLGRTLTHELGHYLNLEHIWGGGCGADDGIPDTPNSESSYGGCPSGYPSTCGSTDMYMNFMDYVNDACMYMFSDGQSVVMENYQSNFLQALATNAATVCTAPTCTDGVMNGNETGVDCGGPDCPACPPPTCTDGIQNGNETGVDCGGPDCPACPLVYCDAMGENSSDEWIESIVVGSFSNVSGNNGGYGDFTSMTIDIELGVDYNFVLTPDWDGTQYNEFWKIYIDLNADGDFDDANEQVYSSGTANQNVQMGTFNLSNSSTLGNTRMRIIMRYNSSPSPCGTFQWGEVEDYTVNLLPGIPPSNDLCSSAETIFEGSFPGDNFNANNTGQVASCGGVSIDGDGVWYTFSSPPNIQVTLDVCNSSFDSKLHVFKGSCSNMVCVAGSDNDCGNDGMVSFITNDGTESNQASTYFVLVSGNNSEKGTFILTYAAAPLPVQLISFEGEALEKENKFSWMVAEETNINYYQLESSIHGVEWKSVGRITAENKNGTKYTFIHETARSAFYRLLIMEHSRLKDYSPNIYLERKQLDFVGVFPNPTNELINIEYSSSKNKDLDLSILDASGKLLVFSRLSLAVGKNIETISLIDLNPGVYFVQMVSDGKRSTERIVKL